MECNNEAARNSDADIASTITAKSVTDNLTTIDKSAQHPGRPTKEPPKPKCFRICGVLPDWREDDLIGALQAIDPSLKDQIYQLSLYPA